MTAAGRAAVVSLALTGLLQGGCDSPRVEIAPSIEWSRVPEAAEGGPDRVEAIEGRVVGARQGQRIVLFARSGAWWVQPLAHEPFTAIGADSRWKSTTHLGTEYGALLVEPGYRPPSRVDTLPALGGGVLAVATVKGTTPRQTQPAKTLLFGGYEWRVRSIPSERGGWTRDYDPENAWTDTGGALHLRIAGAPERLTCAEVTLTRSLGYGTYTFVVREVTHLDPAAVLGLFTWDDAASDHRFREMDVEISRWGDRANQNAQYVIQPYYVPANVKRFEAPAGVLTHSLRWEVGRATFRTFRGSPSGSVSRMLSEHAFASGVPVPGNETVRMNLYVFGAPGTALKAPLEVVIERFEYLP